jgi:hypothetical protein
VTYTAALVQMALMFPMVRVIWAPHAGEPGGRFGYSDGHQVLVLHPDLPPEGIVDVLEQCTAWLLRQRSGSKAMPSHVEPVLIQG